MATVHTSDTMIHFKVNHDGVTKKFRLPLRDLGASTLENKLRDALPITPGTNPLIERFSDSLATYVTLTPDNHSAYKQLLRAAKAKNRLKLRVSTHREPLITINDEAETSSGVDRQAAASKAVPKPVTLEDAPRSLEDLDCRMGSLAIKDRCATEAATETTDATQQYRSRATRSGMTRTVIQPTSSIRAPSGPLSFAQRSTTSEQKAVSPPFLGEPAAPASSSSSVLSRPGYAVCCNNCDDTIPNSHYHCSTCDDGDYDLCNSCVEKGFTCHNAEHWLIKRYVKEGMIINSTTERITPKAKVVKPQPVSKPEPRPESRVPELQMAPSLSHVLYQMDNMRTCNNCISEMDESEFLHCTTCYDFDLCKECFKKDEHGHHPKHAFVAAVNGTLLDTHISKRLPAGRDLVHNAICDSCDSYILGIRYKCLDCPDWDYCSNCHKDAHFVHPTHRFVPLYEPLSDGIKSRSHAKPTHHGICCDGPLCKISSKSRPTYIVGDRYKCAVCHDTDFCANCEASPANEHNKTHPLIKLKTPIRHVSVSTTGEENDGSHMPVMGDQVRHSGSQRRQCPFARSATTSSRSTATMVPDQGIALDSVRTVVDVKPSEPETIIPETTAAEKVEEKIAEPQITAQEPVNELSADDLAAVFVDDYVPDGTVMSPNTTFRQTWILQNKGKIAWPVGTRVKFVGGDYMGHVDSLHPAGLQDLVNASEGQANVTAIAPGEHCTFSVSMRSPGQLGKRTSYWRLTTPCGIKFGDRLWCDILVQTYVPSFPVESETPEEVVQSRAEPPSDLAETHAKDEQLRAEPTSDLADLQEEEAVKTQISSQMIFPKLDKESPIASVYEEPNVESTAATVAESVVDDEVIGTEVDDFENDDDWAEDDSFDGFLTDEEYDILDASDEELMEDQQKRLRKK